MDGEIKSTTRWKETFCFTSCRFSTTISQFEDCYNWPGPINTHKPLRCFCLYQFVSQRLHLLGILSVSAKLSGISGRSFRVSPDWGACNRPWGICSEFRKFPENHRNLGQIIYEESKCYHRQKSCWHFPGDVMKKSLNILWRHRRVSLWAVKKDNDVSKKRNEIF